MKLVDVNILVQAHRQDADQHAEAKDWLEAVLSEPIGIAVSELVLSGVVRIITHPKIFQEPTPLESAMAFIEHIHQLSNVHILSPGPRHWAIFLDLCRRGNAKGNLIPDAYHAALAVETGCEWVTLDRGFTRFPGLKWEIPF
jgi:toxin-antitoxin system PIN domain toxin